MVDATNLVFMVYGPPSARDTQDIALGQEMDLFEGRANNRVRQNV